MLEQAKRDAVPLLERLGFLCIASSILDEFFEIRVSGLKQQAEVGATQRGPDNLSPSEQLRRIARVAHEMVDEQYRVLNDVLFPLLDAEGIRFLKRSRWNAGQETWLRDFFHRELEPILTPIGLDPAHPFPRIINKNLTFIVTLEGKDAFGRASGMAVVQAPRALPRVIRLPEDQAESPHDFVFLSSIIHAHVDELFPGMNAVGCYQFRVTRNSDLFVDEEAVGRSADGGGGRVVVPPVRRRRSHWNSPTIVPRTSGSSSPTSFPWPKKMSTTATARST